MTTRREAIKGTAAAVGLCAVPISARDNDREEDVKRIAEDIAKTIDAWLPPPLLFKPERDFVVLGLPMKRFGSDKRAEVKYEVQKIYPHKIVTVPINEERVSVDYGVRIATAYLRLNHKEMWLA